MCNKKQRQTLAWRGSIDNIVPFTFPFGPFSALIFYAFIKIVSSSGHTVSSKSSENSAQDKTPDSNQLVNTAEHLTARYFPQDLIENQTEIGYLTSIHHVGTKKAQKTLLHYDNMSVWCFPVVLLSPSCHKINKNNKIQAVFMIL